MDFLSSTLMMSRKFESAVVPALVVVFLLTLANGSEIQPKSKRQIYREQVLPSRGGKIPEEAFRTDRLHLNRLNKEGIAIPDGVLLEHRLQHNHPHISKHDPEDEAAVIRVIQKQEDRYVAPPGKYHYKNPPTVASTYIIRKPIGPENTALRTPGHQVHHPFRNQGFNAFNQNSGFHNNIYNEQPHRYQHQFVPEIPQYFPASNQRYPGQNFIQTHQTKHKSVEIPSKKYLPTGHSAQKYLPPGPLAQKYVPAGPPAQKYLPAASPAQKYLPAEYELPPRKFIPQEYQPTVVHHPHAYGYEAPVSYQSVAYYPVHTPLVLPNKEIRTNEYYRFKDQGLDVSGSISDHSNEIHEVIDWPSLLAHYSEVSSKLNAINQESYSGPTAHSQFLTPEVLGSIASEPSYYSEKVTGRYARKSKEIASKEVNSSGCNRTAENTVEDGSKECAA